MSKRVLSIILGLSLLLSAGLASADTISLGGTVTAGGTVEVYAPIGGTVGNVAVEVGQEVGEEDILFSLKTTKVYAEEDGTVTGVFGQPGDSAQTVADRYGAILYLEGSAVYSVSASTGNAYNSTETKFVHVGEKVYLQCRSNKERVGTGVITGIDGTSYTVEVQSGSFIPGDSVDIYRDIEYSNTERIGRGTVNRVSPTAVTGSGSIVRIAVEDGAQVKKGDLLLETLDGSFDGCYMSGTDVPAGQAGIIGSLNVSQGSAVQKDSVAAVIYPLDQMRVEATVPEDSRGSIHAGDPVTIELEADESKVYRGTVTLVSAVAEQGTEEVSYRVLVQFVPDDAIRFGMSVVVNTLEPEETEEPEEEPEEEKAPEEAEEAAADEPAGEAEQTEETEGKGRGGRPDFNGEMPEGFDPENFDPSNFDPSAFGGENGGFPARPSEENAQQETEEVTANEESTNEEAPNE